MSHKSISISLYAILLGVCLSLSTLSCGSAIPNPQQADLETLPNDLSDLTLDNLRYGRQLYVEKCGGCHRLRIPDEFTQSQWIKVLAKMRDRAHLTNSEEQLLISYLRAFAEKPSPSQSSN